MGWGSCLKDAVDNWILNESAAINFFPSSPLSPLPPLLLSSPPLSICDVRGASTQPRQLRCYECVCDTMDIVLKYYSDNFRCQMIRQHGCTYSYIEVVYDFSMHCITFWLMATSSNKDLLPRGVQKQFQMFS